MCKSFFICMIVIATVIEIVVEIAVGIINKIARGITVEILHV